MKIENKETIFHSKLHYNAIKEIAYLGNNMFATSSKDGNLKFWEFGCKF